MSKAYTLVIGASENPERYSNRAISMLRSRGIPVHAVGLRAGFVGDVPVQTGQPEFSDIDTVTLYLGISRQAAVEDYIISLRPRRVIFNPGTENPPFEKRLKDYGIEVEEACTLVLLSSGAY